MKVLVTGNPGSGKSTLTKCMKNEGYNAYDLENVKGAVRLEHKGSGQKAEWPKGYIDWNKYDWNIQGGKLKELLKTVENVFIGISASNIYDFYPLFDRAILLTVSDDELRRRLYERNSHKNNHSKESLEFWISKNTEWNQHAISQGAISVQSGKTPEETMKRVLNACNIA